MSSARKAGFDADVKNRTRAGGRWRAGQSGNPAGRPKDPDTLTGELRAVLALKVKGRTRRRMVAEAIVRRAARGDPAAFRVLASYVDGLPVTKVEDVTKRADERVVLLQLLARHPELRAEAEADAELVEAGESRRN